MNVRYFAICAAVAAASLVAGCRRDGVALPPDAIVRVGDAVLTARDLRQNIPAGLSQADSIKLARAFVRAWIDRRLILDVAASQVDMSEIEKMVEEYRTELIIAAYRRDMATRADGSILPEDSLRAYYESHKAEFALERPLVRGVYLKLPDDASNLRELRRLYNSSRQTDIDRLEKAAASSAIHYDYFRDRWVDWEQIETRIPSHFTDNPDAFLKANKPLDFSADGFTYLLSITDYLPTGTPMPFEAAEPIIRDRLLTRERRRLDTRLRNELYEHSVDDGFVSFPGANPFN